MKSSGRFPHSALIWNVYLTNLEQTITAPLRPTWYHNQKHTKFANFLLTPGAMLGNFSYGVCRRRLKGTHINEKNANACQVVDIPKRDQNSPAVFEQTIFPPAMRPGRDLFVQPSGAARCECGIKPLRNSSLHHIRILRRGMGVRSRRTWLQREEGGECRWHIVTQSWSYCPPKTREDPFFKTGFFRY